MVPYMIFANSNQHLYMSQIGQYMQNVGHNSQARIHSSTILYRLLAPRAIFVDPGLAHSDYW